MKKILIVWCLALNAVNACFAETTTNEIRACLSASIGQIKGRKENLVTKNVKAQKICDMLMTLQPKTAEDASLLVRFLTIADPRKVGGNLKSPSVVFPAVEKLLHLGQVGAEAVLEAVKYEQIDETQAAINMAYVLSHTIGTEKGMEILRAKEENEQLTVQQLEMLHRVATILEKRKATTSKITGDVPQGGDNHGKTQGHTPKTSE